ncbi:DNA mismatch repair protein MutT [Vibrio panuliri]|uniref:8-oxo-dGTP diphosphatase n=1 Tax=Vibrio panuliri TaxID=1381081 RepID=A0A1Q9HHT5_9VIBR|nr:NUDIX hydrolase [Vibrio panuliri]OLQ89682.1 DNA mismatch repair protein MutT [Vibrio panuliri]
MKHLAMAVVVKQGKVLVQKRYRAEKGMVLEFPGGKVGLDETGTDAAIRELAEETGIRGLKHTATYTKVNQLGGRIYFVILRANEGVEPKASDASIKQEFSWMSPEIIPQDDFHPADREFINQYLQQYSLIPA